MSTFIVDVEADGKCPGIYSMVSFAAIKVQEDIETAPSFRAETAPISEKWIPSALAVSEVTREQHLNFPDQSQAMQNFAKFILENSKPGERITFLSDNPAFDWQFINYYFVLNDIQNPFGHTARRIGDFCAGLERNWFAGSRWKRKRKTKHSHDPLDDVRGNLEAFIYVCKKNNIKFENAVTT